MSCGFLMPFRDFHTRATAFVLLSTLRNTLAPPHIRSNPDVRRLLGHALALTEGPQFWDAFLDITPHFGLCLPELRFEGARRHLTAAYVAIHGLPALDDGLAGDLPPHDWIRALADARPSLASALHLRAADLVGPARRSLESDHAEAILLALSAFADPNRAAEVRTAVAVEPTLADLLLPWLEPRWTLPAPYTLPALLEPWVHQAAAAREDQRTEHPSHKAALDAVLASRTWSRTTRRAIVTLAFRALSQPDDPRRPWRQREERLLHALVDDIICSTWLSHDGGHRFANIFGPDGDGRRRHLGAFSELLKAWSTLGPLLSRGLVVERDGTAVPLNLEPLIDHRGQTATLIAKTFASMGLTWMLPSRCAELPCRPSDLTPWEARGIMLGAAHEDVLSLSAYAVAAEPTSSLPVCPQTLQLAMMATRQGDRGWAFRWFLYSPELMDRWCHAIVDQGHARSIEARESALLSSKLQHLPWGDEIDGVRRLLAALRRLGPGAHLCRRHHAARHHGLAPRTHPSFGLTAVDGSKSNAERAVGSPRQPLAGVPDAPQQVLRLCRRQRHVDVHGIVRWRHDAERQVRHVSDARAVDPRWWLPRLSG